MRPNWLFLALSIVTGILIGVTIMEAICLIRHQRDLEEQVAQLRQKKIAHGNR